MRMTGTEPVPVLINVLGYIPGLRYFSNFYKYIIHTADPRAEKYPLMGNPDTTAAIVLSYLLFCLMFGPKYMRGRGTPTFTQGMLCFYNLISIYINGFLALTLSHHVFSTKQSLMCEPIDDSQEAGASWVMTLLYIFHLSKIVELVDTIFLVWKKKDSQLSFLHIYHHSTIVAATWIGVKFAPGGTTAVICMINSWVHVFMYSYYQLTAIRVNLSKRYKKFLTLVQMGQFCYTLAVCANGLWIAPCNYPDWILWWLFLYMLSFLTLFSNFFYETYAKKKATGGSFGMRAVPCSVLPDPNLDGFTKNLSRSGPAPLVTNGIGPLNGILSGKSLAKDGIGLGSVKNGHGSGRSHSPVNITLPRTRMNHHQIPLHTVLGSRTLMKGFDLPRGDQGGCGLEIQTEEIIFNDVIGLTRVIGKPQQLSAELKIVSNGNGIEVTNANGSDANVPNGNPTISRERNNLREPTKVRKLKKKKSQKKK